MHEVEEICSRDIDGLYVEIRYSVCVNPIIDENEEMIRIVFEDDYGPEMFFYPEHARDILVKKDTFSSTSRFSSDKCSLCQEPAQKDMKSYNIDKTLVQAHTHCIEKFEEELRDFCSHPKILVKNL